MIQFNLLPDVKIEYIKARRQKRLVMLVSTLAAAAALTAFIFLVLFVDVLQKKNLGDLSRDIKSNSSELQNTKDLNKILTVQSQLDSLTALHDAKPVTPRLFGYLAQLTPSAANVSKLTADYQLHTLAINGGADNLGTVNKFVDTLKFTKYTVKGHKGSKPAFSNVVQTQFSRNDKGATYTINLAFDPTIFDEKGDTTLTVPNIISTRSEIGKPAALFQKLTSGTNQ